MIGKNADLDLMHRDVRDGRGVNEGMSEREIKIRKRFADDMDPDYDDARYLIGVIDVLRWDRQLLRDAAEDRGLLS